MMVVVGGQTWRAFLYSVISIEILEETVNLLGWSALINFMRQNLYLERNQGQIQLCYIKVLI